MITISIPLQLLNQKMHFDYLHLDKSRSAYILTMLQAMESMDQFYVEYLLQL